MYVKYKGPDIAGGFISNAGTGSEDVQKIVAIDKKGRTWTWSESKMTGGEFATKFFRQDNEEKDIVYPLRFTCDDLGPNAAESEIIGYTDEGDLDLNDSNHGYIFKTIDSILYPFEVWQNGDAVIGSDTESDQSLRSRRLQSRSDNGISTLSGLKGSLKSLGGIEEVKIYNNNSTQDSSQASADKQPKDGTIMGPHEVYICIRYSEQNIFNSSAINALDEPIGTTIYNKLTPGVPTTKSSIYAAPSLRQYDYSLSDSLPTASVYWKMCYPVMFDSITLNIMMTDNYDKLKCEPEIKKNCKDFARSISISEDLSLFNLIAYLNANSSLINNKTPYYVMSGYINGDNTKFDIKNDDNFFDLNRVLYLPAPSDDWVKITILSAEEKAEKTNADYPNMVCYKKLSTDEYPSFELLLTRSTDVSSSEWYSSNSFENISFTANEFNEGTTASVSASNRLIYYTGEDFSWTTYVEFTTPGGTQRSYSTFSMNKNNYYYISEEKIGGYGSYKYCLKASKREIIDGYFTQQDHLSEVINATDIADIQAIGGMVQSIVDSDNNYVYKEGSASTGGGQQNLEYRKLAYTYEYTEGSNIVKLTIAPESQAQMSSFSLGMGSNSNTNEEENNEEENNEIEQEG